MSPPVDHPSKLAPGASAWTVGARVTRPDGTDAGVVVEVTNQIKVRWDSGRTSYFKFGQVGNVRLEPTPEADAMRQECEAHALDAEQLARKTSSAIARHAWEMIAQRWRKLAAISPNQCFCGRPAVGLQPDRHGSYEAFCEQHLHDALLRGTKVGSGPREASE